MANQKDFDIFSVSKEEGEAILLFFPEMFERTLNVTKTNQRFVHYTSADVAISIIKNREIWMRRSSTMNDFQEVEYGIACLNNIWSGTIGKTFIESCDSIFPGISVDINVLLRYWTPYYRSDTYLTSVSEHESSEDTLGRLSMWRAYGGSAGVAIVLNNNAFVAPSDALHAYLVPVSYLTKEEFECDFSRFVENILSNKEQIIAMGKSNFTYFMLMKLKISILCTKHPGFHEEKEWRIIYSPLEDSMKKLKSDIKSIQGTPQQVYFIPLKDIPEEGLIGMEPSQLIERIIIGPTQYPNVIADAFLSVLEQAGVSDAKSKIFVSDIPLRR